ncbi:D-serine dehydratase-like isoform X2 [Glandiceps talaboti]
MLCLKRTMASKIEKDGDRKKEIRITSSQSGPIAPSKNQSNKTREPTQSAPSTPSAPLNITTLIEEINHTEMPNLNETKEDVLEVEEPKVMESKSKTGTLQRMDTTSIGKSIENLMTPALVIDINKVQANVSKMMDRAEEYGVRFRPHMKAHKTLEGAEIMTGGKKHGIAVSTLAEASFYSAAGYDDILYTGYMEKSKIEMCAEIAEQLDRFHILLDSYYIIELLRDRPLKNGKLWSIFIDVDSESNGCGVNPGEYAGVGLAVSITSEASMQFNGLYVNCSNAYKCSGPEEVERVGEQTADMVIKFAEKLRKMKKHKVNVPEICYGSTPMCSLPGPTMKMVTEWQAGNYIFHDVEGQRLGACQTKDIAIQVLAKVIAHYPNRKQILIDCGWTALSLHGAEHGYCAFQGHPHLRIISMKQEASVVDDERGNLDHSRFPIGTVLRLFPFNGSASAALHRIYYVHSDSKIVEEWTPIRGW